MKAFKDVLSRCIALQFSFASLNLLLTMQKAEYENIVNWTV